MTEMEKGKIRIIGGKWKGKKISFEINSKLRPTPDRAKEMIFNWLGNDLRNYNCLDIFAGTGAMGLESLSRGAKKVDFIEKDVRASQILKKNLIDMTDRITFNIFNESYESWFKKNDSKFSYDLIFIDPPFEKNFIEKVFNFIEEKKIYRLNTVFYLEAEKKINLDFLLADYEIFKEKTMGRKSYRLLRKKIT